MAVIQNARSSAALPGKAAPAAIMAFIGLIIMLSVAGLTYAKHGQLFA